MNQQLEAPADAQSLRKTLHQRVDELRDEDLVVLNRVLGQLKIDTILVELDDAFDKARVEGRLTPERIHEAIALHRAKHPYR